MRPDDKRLVNPGAPKRETCVHGHELGDSDNVGTARRVTPSGKVTRERYCKTCVRKRNREYGAFLRKRKAEGRG